MSLTVQLHPELETAAAPIAERLAAAGIPGRLAARDAELWGPAAAAEAAQRLAWTSAPTEQAELLPLIAAHRARLLAAGVTRIVLGGMGGSSLGPEVIAAATGAALTVLDSTHPTQVASALALPMAETAAVFSSKSGSTVETTSQLHCFERAFAEAGIDPAERITVVTDPGSALWSYATERGYTVYLGDPEIGGRYSVLTAFGLVPTGLAGAPVEQLVAEAVAVLPALAADTPENPALRLAAVLAAQQPERNALVLESSRPGGGGLGDWIEQLVAESTGKHGVGVLPVVIGSAAPETRRPVRNGVLARAELDSGPLEPGQLHVSGPLGGLFQLWETATALLGHELGINPFDQPDVESAKQATRAFLAGDSVAAPVTPVEIAPGLGLERSPAGGIASLAELIAAVRAAVPAGGYLAVQAYLDAGAHREVAGLRDAFAATGLTVTFGWGPRFLHSTGQIHKGGPANGVFLQLLDHPVSAEPIPDSSYSFAELITAQALGDAEVLSAHGLSVFTLRCADPTAAAAAIASALSAEPTAEQ